jgi:hypothetical protein
MLGRGGCFLYMPVGFNARPHEESPQISLPSEVIVQRIELAAQVAVGIKF